MPMDSVLQVTKKQDANGTTTSLDNHSSEFEHPCTKHLRSCKQGMDGTGKTGLNWELDAVE